MNKWKLAISVDYQHDVFRLRWVHPEEGEGGFLQSMPDHEINESADNREHRYACNAAEPLADGSDWKGLFWYEAVSADKARRVAVAAVAADNKGSTLPEWALKALAAGWKKPRGWKP